MECWSFHSPCHDLKNLTLPVNQFLDFSKEALTNARNLHMMMTNQCVIHTRKEEEALINERNLREALHKERNQEEALHKERNQEEALHKERHLNKTHHAERWWEDHRSSPGSPDGQDDTSAAPQTQEPHFEEEDETLEALGDRGHR